MPKNLNFDVMDEESQRFMALEGLHTWGRGVAVQVDRLKNIRKRMSTQTEDLLNLSRSFNRERHFFLIAASMLVDHIKWARQLAFLDEEKLSALSVVENDIKSLRHKNEHVVEYFSGHGKHMSEWTYETEYGVSDASSTVGSKLGNKLDWDVVEAAVQTMVDGLPDFYHRQNRPEGHG